jgi:polar amino acid transport system permease protein
MVQPFKKRKLDKAARPGGSGGGPGFTIEITDGPAVPRAADPGLYSAWKFVVLATPLVLLLLCSYDYLAGLALAAFPGFFEPQGLMRRWADDGGHYRRALFFIMPGGLWVTTKITLYSILLVLPLGVLTGLCRISKIRWVNLTASVYVEVVRGIPLLVQLYYIYYAVSTFITVPPVVSAVLAMSFCYGAYMGEVVRSGIESIDRGQREAALSLGFTPFQTMFKVILPQAVRTILPPVGNECIALLKDSSLVSIIALPDILRLAREFATRTYWYFEAYTVVALIYLFITLMLSKLVSLTESRVSRYERR